MTMIHRFRFLAATAALAFGAVLTFAGSADAGALQIRDQAHVISADDAARLRSVVMAAPFDARLVVTTEYPGAQDLSRYVGSLVTEANAVVVGLDPQHRHVEVHYGTGSRIAESNWPAIDRAGNDEFRREDWEGGVAAIFRAASSAVSGPVASGGGEQVAPVAPVRPSFFSPGLLLVLLLGGIGLAIWFARRRTANYGPMGGQGYGPPPYGGQGYPLGGPQGGGMGPVGGGLLGAGLGGLAGYEIGKLEGEREDRGRGGDQGNFGGERGGGGGGGGFDAGGGGSGWDDGGGGSGGDGGGGGFDGGGGGGSDF